MADQRSGRGGRGTYDRNYGQAGGYGQVGPGLNYEDPGEPHDPPYRVAPSPEGGGYHLGHYAAEHYREPSEREPGYRPGRGYEARRGPHAGRGPKGYRRSDERIAEDVNERLTEDAYLDATDIEVAVADGVVTLSGSVDGRPDKRRAEDIADAVSGVRDVSNQLRIQRNDVDAIPPSPLETRDTGRTGAKRTTRRKGDIAASRSGA
jgi:hypothetical protein